MTARPAKGRRKAPMRLDHAETLATYLRLAGIRSFVREHPIASGRRFRADLFFTASGHKGSSPLVVEVEGGGWIAGRHSRGAGIESDCEKSALIAANGWRLLRCTPRQVKDGRAVKWIEAALKSS